MPVKNIKRRTNDGLEGTITGLTEEEKEVLQKNLSIDDMNKVIPTDVAIKDNKLGLEHDSTWLTNQNAINLGSNMKYDATTNTLDASGGDELTGQKLADTISSDNINITATNDKCNLSVSHYTRLYRNGIVDVGNFTIPAGTYKVGQCYISTAKVSLRSKTTTGTTNYITPDNVHINVIPSTAISGKAVDSEPIFIYHISVSSDGELGLYLMCIKEGTFAATHTINGFPTSAMVFTESTN